MAYSAVHSYVYCCPIRLVFVHTFTCIWQLLYAVSKSFRDADMLDFKNSYLYKRYNSLSDLEKMLIMIFYLRSVLNKVYNILTASNNVSNTAEGGRAGISLLDFMKLMRHYQQRKGMDAHLTVKLSKPQHWPAQNTIRCMSLCLTPSESEVLCMFKALVGTNCQDEGSQIHNQTISREKFLTFYEMRDLRWKQERAS